MKEQLIEFTKEKGFDSNIQIVHDNYKTADGGKTRELLNHLWMCELQKWLRDVHDINVNVELYSYSTKLKVIKSYRVVVFDWVNGEKYDESFTYEQALEKGLQEALKLI